MADRDDIGPAVFEAMARNARDVVTLIAPDGTVQFLNRSIVGQFGWQPEELIGRNIVDYIHPDDVESATASLNQALTDEDRPRLMCRFRHKSGEWRHVEVTGQVLEVGDFNGVLLHSRDITQRERNLAEQRASQELFEAAFNATSAICTITVPETGEYINVNNAFVEQTGWSRDEVIGRTASDIGIWGADDNRARIIGELGNKGYLRQHRAEVVFRDGTSRVLLVDATYLNLIEGRRMFLSAIDISERERVEAHLRQSQKMEAIGQLTGGIAHDFNNLLSVISGHAELAIHSATDPDKVKSSMESVLQASASGARLIQQMMAFSRKQNLHPEALSLGERIRSLMPLMQTTVGKDIRFTIKAPPRDCWVSLDPAQFDAALLNLVINARDAMPQGGEIRIDIWYETSTGAEQEGRVRVSITDTGHGMPPRSVERAFEPFYTTKDDAGGTGLGLSMVFGFVRQSGGEVSLASREDEGTRVDMTFPIIADPGTHESSVQSSALPDLSDRRILLVEDNDNIRLLLEGILRERLRADITVRSSGEGLEELGDDFDLLVTDVMLPGRYKGPDIGRHLRATKPGLAIVYLSGYQAGVVAESDLDHRAVFMQKPFSYEDLLQTIGRLMAR